VSGQSRKQISRFGEAKEDFCFYDLFEMNFSGHKKIGKQNLWPTALECPRGY